MMDYASWSRKKLLQHVRAYAAALHDLGNVAMKQEAELRKLRPLAVRVDALDKCREHLHGRPA